MITAEWLYNDEVELVKCNKNEYFNKDGIKVIRLPIRGRDLFHKKIKKHSGLYAKIENEKPDILFIRGCQFIDMNVIVKYLKANPNIRIYIDNHSDFSNSPVKGLSKNLPEEYQIVLVGVTRKEKEILPKNIISIEKTNNVKELAPIYTAADIFFNASVEETFGLTTFQAMACGTPVIVYNVTALPESVTVNTCYIVESLTLARLLIVLRRAIKRNISSSVLRKQNIIWLRTIQFIYQPIKKQAKIPKIKMLNRGG